MVVFFYAVIHREGKKHRHLAPPPQKTSGQAARKLVRRVAWDSRRTQRVQKDMEKVTTHQTLKNHWKWTCALPYTDVEGLYLQPLNSKLRKGLHHISNPSSLVAAPVCAEVFRKWMGLWDWVCKALCLELATQHGNTTRLVEECGVASPKKNSCWFSLGVLW